MLISSIKDMKRYARELGVHRKLRTAISWRKRVQVEAYNVSRIISSTAVILNVVQEKSKKTHLASFKDAPAALADLHQVVWAFDVADIADVLLTFGSLGPLLLGNTWEVESQNSQAVTADMLEIYRKLPGDLPDIQKLLFKPLPLLEEAELLKLVDTLGDSVNPLVRYLQKAGRSLVDDDLESDDDFESDEDSDARSEVGSIYFMFWLI
jgi:hypothetical protein